MTSHLKRWAIAAAVSFMAFNTPALFAAGSGHSHSGSGHGQHNQSMHHNNGNSNQLSLPPFANSWPYLRAENGIFGPLWAAPGPGSLISFGNGGGFVGGGGGWGGGGWGWGGGVTDYDYYTGRMPYFAVYSPTYYGYDDGAIVAKTQMQFPMANTAYHPNGNQPFAGQQAASAPEAASPAAAASPQPLRIANPYYSEK
jgi:hypothetical protein